MAPISKKTGTGPAGKNGSGSLISKTPSGKSSSVLKFGSKQNNSSSLAGKSSSASLGSKNSSPSFGGKSDNTAASSSKKVPKNSNADYFSNSTNFGHKISGAQSYDGKRTATNFSELGISSKSSKTSSDPLKTITPKSFNAPNTVPKNEKSSMRFGIIWLPTRRRNKMKYSVYNPYDTDRHDAFKERTPSMYNFMSGDTSDPQTFKKKREETDLLVSDGTKLQPAPSDGLLSDIEKTGKAEENQEFLKQSKEESREAAGDSYEKYDSNDYLENKESLNKAPDAIWQKNKGSDKVDSVYLQPSVPHKARSVTTNVEEDSCGIKFLYYTLQCCDCVIM